MDGIEWNLEMLLPRLAPKFGDAAIDPLGGDRASIIPDHEVTDEMLLESLGVMAEVITVYGEAFLPIFERLHRELEARRQRALLLEEAFRLSRQP